MQLVDDGNCGCGSSVNGCWQAIVDTLSSVIVPLAARVTETDPVLMTS